MPLYPAAEDEDEDYYTLSNPVFAGERFAPGSEGAIAFDEPSAGGVRYPLAAPATGGRVGQFGDVTPDLQRALDAMIARDRPKSDALYNAQMERVNRNEIADTGGDPMAVQQAIRLQGLRKYQKLLADGASNSEAYRLAAPELTFNHPQALASAMNHTVIPQVPSISTVPVGNRQAVFVDGRYRTTVPTPVTKDPIKELEGKEANEAVTQAMRALSNAQKSLLPDPEAIAAAQRELEAARMGRRNLIRGVESPLAAPKPSSIPKGAIEKLKANPNLADDFDAMFGTGSAKAILGK